MIMTKLGIKTSSQCKVTLLLIAAFLQRFTCQLLQKNEKYSKSVFHFPEVSVTEDDAYLCIAIPVADLDGSYFVGSRIDAIPNIQHHVSLSVCEKIDDGMAQTNPWNCLSRGVICKKGKNILLDTWTRRTKHHIDTMLPEDVGIPLGEKGRLNTFYLQAHFKNKISDPSRLQGSPINLTIYTTNERRPYSIQQITFSIGGYIPPLQYAFKTETACLWSKPPVQLYLYSVHTHNYGRLVEGYLKRNNSILTLAHDNPQKKNTEWSAFRNGPVQMKTGDILGHRCIYRNTGNKVIIFGPRDADEMCAFVLAFKYKIEDATFFQHSLSCDGSAQIRA